LELIRKKGASETLGPGGRDVAFCVTGSVASYVVDDPSRRFVIAETLIERNTEENLSTGNAGGAVNPSDSVIRKVHSQLVRLVRRKQFTQFLKGFAIVSGRSGCYGRSR
jgi:hypothetical protein